MPPATGVWGQKRLLRGIPRGINGVRGLSFRNEGRERRRRRLDSGAGTGEGLICVDKDGILVCVDKTTEPLQISMQVPPHAAPLAATVHPTRTASPTSRAVYPKHKHMHGISLGNQPGTPCRLTENTRKRAVANEQGSGEGLFFNSQSPLEH